MCLFFPVRVLRNAVAGSPTHPRACVAAARAKIAGYFPARRPLTMRANQALPLARELPRQCNVRRYDQHEFT